MFSSQILNKTVLSIHSIQGEAASFPDNPYGTHQLTFGNKSYKFIGGLIFSLSSVLKQKFAEAKSSSIDLQLATSNNEESFDLVMQALYGLDDIFVPKELEISVLGIILELDINNKKNTSKPFEKCFQEDLLENILIKLDINQAIEAFQIGKTLGNVEIKNKALEVLIDSGFKSLIDKSSEFLKLSENSFIELLQLNCENKKRMPNLNTFLTEEDLKTIIYYYYNHKCNDKAQKNEKIKNAFTSIGIKNIGSDSICPTNNLIQYEMNLKIEDIQAKIDDLVTITQEYKKQNEILKDDVKTLKDIVMGGFEKDMNLCKDLKEVKQIAQNLQSQIMIIEETQEVKIADHFDKLLNRIEKMIKTHMEAPSSELNNKSLVLPKKSNDSIIINPFNDNNNDFNNNNSPIKNYFYGPISTLLTLKYIDNLTKWLLPTLSTNKLPLLKLLYRGTQENFRVSAFHKKCDLALKTLIIIKSNKNQIFGGYTEVIWENPCEDDFSFEGFFRPDKNAFIFSLTRGEKYPCFNYKEAIFIDSVSMASFGHHDIYIRDEANKIMSECHFPKTYSVSEGTNNSLPNLAGAEFFLVCEMEVFELLENEVS